MSKRLERVRKRLASVDSGSRLSALEKQIRALDKRLSPGLRRVERYESAHVRAGLLDYEGAEIYMRLGSFPEFQRLRSCHSEPWTVEWIENWVKPDEVFYDIGANVGAYTLVAALSPASQARVVAFEPVALNYAALTENVVLNDASDRITPLPVALDDSTRLDTLHLRILDAGGARHSLGSAEGAEAAVHPQPVLTFRLDDLVEQMALPQPAHMKIDVDGSEVAVLRGASRTLADPGLRSVLCELDHNVADDIVALLDAAGLPLHERFQREKPGAKQPPAYGLFARA